MKILLATAVLASLTVPAFAQSSPTTHSQSPQAQQPQTQNQTTQNQAGSTQGLVAAQKVKQDLQKAGFSDVKVVAESFVVQGKSPDGDPVVMTIGPHGMSVFEAMNANSSSSGTVGSNRSPSGSNGSSSNPAASSGSGMQRK